MVGWSILEINLLLNYLSCFASGPILPRKIRRKIHTSIQQACIEETDRLRGVHSLPVVQEQGAQISISGVKSEIRVAEWFHIMLQPER